ncbi:MAG: hypothetical protein JSU94_15490 [Phycisphaerales bacterium]|nr:MAG: hypothetical protein JSU94_15490 [Phycisphaerales bacterium]
MFIIRQKAVVKSEKRRKWRGGQFCPEIQGGRFVERSYIGGEDPHRLAARGRQVIRGGLGGRVRAASAASNLSQRAPIEREISRGRSAILEV